MDEGTNSGHAAGHRYTRNMAVEKITCSLPPNNELHKSESTREPLDIAEQGPSNIDSGPSPNPGLPRFVITKEQVQTRPPQPGKNSDVPNQPTHDGRAGELEQKLPATLSAPCNIATIAEGGKCSDPALLRVKETVPLPLPVTNPKGSRSGSKGSPGGAAEALERNLPKEQRAEKGSLSGHGVGENGPGEDRQSTGEPSGIPHQKEPAKPSDAAGAEKARENLSLPRSRSLARQDQPLLPADPSRRSSVSPTGSPVSQSSQPSAEGPRSSSQQSQGSLQPPVSSQTFGPESSGASSGVSSSKPSSPLATRQDIVPETAPEQPLISSAAVAGTVANDVETPTRPQWPQETPHVTEPRAELRQGSAGPSVLSEPAGHGGPNRSVSSLDTSERHSPSPSTTERSSAESSPSLARQDQPPFPRDPSRQSFLSRNRSPVTQSSQPSAEGRRSSSQQSRGSLQPPVSRQAFGPQSSGGSSGSSQTLAPQHHHGVRLRPRYVPSERRPGREEGYDGVVADLAQQVEDTADYRDRPSASGQFSGTMTLRADLVLRGEGRQDQDAYDNRVVSLHPQAVVVSDSTDLPPVVATNIAGRQPAQPREITGIINISLEHMSDPERTQILSEFIRILGNQRRETTGGEDLSARLEQLREAALRQLLETLLPPHGL